MNDSRNMILALVLSAVVLFGWSSLSEKFFPAPPPPAKVEQGATAPAAAPAAGEAPAAGQAPVAGAPAALRERAAVLAEGPRLKVRSPSLSGSINLTGARIDDLVLLKHRETIDPKSPPIRLLSPTGAKDAYFLQLGWSGEGVKLPDAGTVWTSSAPVLEPGKPVTLSWDNGAGQTFQIELKLDNDYLLTATQRVANRGNGPVAVRPWTLASRDGVSKDPDSWTIHTGPIGAFDGKANYSINFKDLDEAGSAGTRFATTGGWIGFTDKYWLTAMIPDPKTAVDSGFRAANGRYQADMALPTTLIPAGKVVSTTSYLFAGAKEVRVLEQYEDQIGVIHFDKAIDWGWFYWFEKPIFALLHWLFEMVGNFGVAIILLTAIVRGLMFPIAQKQFASMASMRALQPKMKVLQDKYKDDKPRLQQEMLKLYQEEKVNPLAGCLPILLQIPIFYALYKVLMLTIEMRHQPFALWIKDLSAPDPLTPVNLFGLLPFTPPTFLAIGVLPILLGITMWLQQKLNPAPTDEIQKQVFAIMPWMFMVIMAPFAAGLQLYWVVSNTLTILQQKWLYSRHPAMKEAAAK